MTEKPSLHQIILHGFFRSTASWRVRIALELKGLAFRQQSYRLREGEQRSAPFLKLNPQGLVPALEIDGLILTQSLAICEYLDEAFPQHPLVGTSPVNRARIRAFAQAIACDIHPVQNLKILMRLGASGLGQQDIDMWARRTVTEGLDACEALLPDTQDSFCFGEQPTLADICLIPQLANGRRFGVTGAWPRLKRIEERCLTLPAFTRAAPENQPDFEP